MSSCHWMAGVEICEPPTTTGEPGCCFGNPDAAYSSRWMTACTAFFTERDCLLLTDDMSVPRCAWESLGEYEDCEQVWPTTTASPTDAPGCCYGDSYKANDKCAKATEQGKCEDKGCSWLETDDPDDCIITTTSAPTTTSSPTEPAGCCHGDSYKANDKCAKATAQDKCEDKGCSWLVTDDPDDCIITTTSEVTTDTPTEEPGCCKGDTAKSNSACNLKDTKSQCERSGKCEWIKDGSIEEECYVATTDPPTTTSEQGCCDTHSDDLKTFTMCNGKDSQRTCERSG